MQALSLPSRAALSPRRLNQLFAWAFSLDALGRNEEAVRAYSEVIALDPRHPQAPRAYVNLAWLLVSAGKLLETRDKLLEAVEITPGRAALHSELATVLVALRQRELAVEHYEQALRLNPADTHAHSGLAILYLQLEQPEKAHEHARLGLLDRVNPHPYRGHKPPISILIISSALGGGVPIGRFADDRVFQRWVLIPEFFAPDGQLPAHDLVFNAIGDADLCPEALRSAERILQRSTAPILNLPARVLETERAGNARRLGKIPNVVTPKIEELARTRVSSQTLAERGFNWPVLVRSPGFQLGEHFVKVNTAEELEAALQELPGESLLFIQFIDTSGADGKFRKFRVMMIDGKLFPLHVAVSYHWKVHYFSAQMDEAAHRAEDEALLTDMSAVLGPKGVAALAEIQKMLGLDYAGIDCGLDKDGNLVVYEANAMMWFDQPGEEGWEYRVAPFERVRQAVRDMLARRAGKTMGEP